MGQGGERLPAKQWGFFSRVIQSGSSSEIKAMSTGDIHAKASSFANRVSGGLVEVKRDAVSTPNSTMGSAKMCSAFMNSSPQVRARMMAPTMVGTTAAGAALQGVSWQQLLAKRG